MDTSTPVLPDAVSWTSNRWSRGIARPDWLAYGFALAVTWLVLYLRLAAGYAPVDSPVIILFLLVVIFSARLGGIGPGLFSTLLAAGVIDWFLLPQMHHWNTARVGDFWWWLVFVLSGIIVSALFEGHRRMRVESLTSRRLRDVTLASICDAVMTTDGSGIITFVNSEAERLTGWKSAQALGRPIKDVFNLINEQTYDRAEDPVIAVLRSRTSARPANHTLLVSRDGARIPVSRSASPIQRSDGRIEGVVLVFRNVSESRMVAAELEHRLELQGQVTRIIENTPAVIYSFRRGPDGAITFPYASPAIETILEVSAKDLAANGALAFSRVHPDDLPRLLTTIEESARTMSPWECEFRAVSSTRGETWVDGRSVPYREADGGIVWFGCLNDVTERKRSEVAVEASENKFRSYVENAPFAVLVANPAGKIVESNLAAAEMFGYRSEVLNTLTVMDLHPTAERDTVLNALTILRQSGSTEGDYRSVRQDGREIWVHLRAVRLYEGYSLGFCQDITQRKQAELQLRQSQQSLQLALDAGRLGVWSADFKAGRLVWDQRARELFGFEASGEVSFQQCLDAITPDTRGAVIQSIERQKLGDTSDVANDFRITLPDGGERWISGRARATRNADGILLRLDGLIMDISEQRNAETKFRKLERQYLHAQKMEAVGRLAGGVAHDFNNLLMVIQGYTEMLQDEMPDDYHGRKYAQQILTASMRAAGLTRQLLTFSRKQVLCPVSLNLNQVVEETSKMTRRLLGEDIEVRLDMASPLWTVKADVDQMGQVLMNLAVNARDAMPHGGTLSIATKNITVKFAGREEHGWVNAGDYVSMTVTDTGIGMSKEVQEHLFEPFFTTKEDGKGTGLGLATVYGIAQQSGGYVWAKSELGQGTRFTIFLPATKVAAPKSVAAGIEQNPRGTEKLLVVEDDADLHQTLVEFLAERGYAVLAAASPQEALLIARQCSAPIDLLITDVVMPGIRGPELSKEIRRHHPEIKTIYMSGYIDDAVSRHDVTIDNSTFLQKPVSLHALALKLREVLNQADVSDCGAVSGKTIVGGVWRPAV
ncbi:MAG: PAS domain S-box protein [Candidatus Korobacteraceae bacterium]